MSKQNTSDFAIRLVTLLNNLKVRNEWSYEALWEQLPQLRDSYTTLYQRMTRDYGLWNINQIDAACTLLSEHTSVPVIDIVYYLWSGNSNQPLLDELSAEYVWVPRPQNAGKFAEAVADCESDAEWTWAHGTTIDPSLLEPDVMEEMFKAWNGSATKREIDASKSVARIRRKKLVESGTHEKPRLVKTITESNFRNMLGLKDLFSNVTGGEMRSCAKGLLELINKKLIAIRLIPDNSISDEMRGRIASYDLIATIGDNLLIRQLAGSLSRRMVHRKLPATPICSDPIRAIDSARQLLKDLQKLGDPDLAKNLLQRYS